MKPIELGKPAASTKSTSPVRARVLQRAEALTCGPRSETYGSPAENMEATARLWSAFLGCEISGAQVAVCQALLKIARLKTTPDHQDSHDDAAAYMAISYECMSEVAKDS